MPIEVGNDTVIVVPSVPGKDGNDDSKVTFTISLTRIQEVDKSGITVNSTMIIYIII